MARGDYDGAVDAFRRFAAAASEAQLGDTYCLLGDAYRAKRDYADAVSAYTVYIAAHQNDKSGQAIKGRAFAHLGLGQNTEAAADYRTYLTLRPDDPNAHYCVIPIAGQAQIPAAELIKRLRDTIAKDPGNLALRKTLAAKEIETKDFAAAIVQYDAVLAAKPDDASAIYNRGIAYSLMSDWHSAVSAFVLYTRLKPTDPDGWKNLGVNRIRIEDFRGSIVALTQYMDLTPTDPDYIDAYKYRGIDYFDLGDWKNAAADLKKYVSARPNDADTAYLLAQALKNGKDNLILDSTEADTSLNQNSSQDRVMDAQAWQDRGSHLLFRNEYQNAIVALTASYMLKADPKTLYLRALGYDGLARAGDASAYAKVEADCSAAITLQPDYVDAVALKADAEYRDNKLTEARSDYVKLVSLPMTPRFQNYSAWTLLVRIDKSSKDIDGVIADAGALIASSPDDMWYYNYVRGTAYIETSRFDLAIPDLLKFTSRATQGADGFYYLGLAYAGTKKYQDATRCLDKAVLLKPDMYDYVSQAAKTHVTLAEGNSSDPAKAAAEYDRAIALFEHAANSATASQQEQSDARMRRDAAIKARAVLIRSIDPSK